MTCLTAPGLDRAALDAALEDVFRNFDDHAHVIRTGLAIERMVRVTQSRPAELGRIIGRAAAKMTLRTSGVAELLCQVHQISADPVIARGLAALVVELIRTIGSAVDPDEVSVRISCMWSGKWLIVSVATSGAPHTHVLGGRALHAYLRASRLAEVLGGELVRGADGDAMIFGVALRWMEQAVPEIRSGNRSGRAAGFELKFGRQGGLS